MIVSKFQNEVLYDQLKYLIKRVELKIVDFLLNPFFFEFLITNGYNKNYLS